jgi:hypothetical protein
MVGGNQKVFGTGFEGRIAVLYVMNSRLVWVLIMVEHDNCGYPCWKQSLCPGFFPLVGVSSIAAASVAPGGRSSQK